jgi:phytoene desaturase
MAKKIVVIGSGFGGLAASLRLKAKGYDVTLVEKHPDLGGRARVFKKGEFIYDGGPTVITAPYLFEELFSLFNKKISDYVKIVPLDLWYRFVFNDGETFDYSGNNESMEKQVKKFSAQDFNGYKKLVNFTEKIFDKGFTDLSDKPFNSLVFMIKQIPALFKLKSYKSVYSLVSNYISHEKLRRVFSMHPLLVGGNPFSTTSIYTLILFLEKKWGIHYSMGGTGNIVKALEKLMKEENIKIIKSAEVTEILTENKDVKAVKINNLEVINCDYVVCNSDPPNVYKNLIKSKGNYNFLFKQTM